jgi:hypothetical protein
VPVSAFSNLRVLHQGGALDACALSTLSRHCTNLRELNVPSGCLDLQEPFCSLFVPPLDGSTVGQF